MLVKSLKTVATISLVSFLSGCLHVQLFGSVSDAQITIASIYDRDNVVFEATTTGRDLWINANGQEVWDSWGPLLQTWVLGIVSIDEKIALDDDAIYLVTVLPGGRDEDAADGNGLLDAEGTTINSSFHAILTGAQIKGALGKVSILTEMMYQAMFIETGSIDGHDDRWFFDELDKFSDRLVDDLNGDGSIDYEDVLEWSVLFSSSEYIGDRSLLDQYSQDIVEGSSNDQQRFDRAVAILDSGINTEHELAGSWSLEVGPGTLDCSDGSVTDLASFTENITVSIVGAAISFPANDWSGIPDWEISTDSGINGSFDDSNDSFSAAQVLTGIPQINPDLGEQTITVSYSGQFNGGNWSGTYEYQFSIIGFDFSCESTQAFSGRKLD
jgi:hypothetical protein